LSTSTLKASTLAIMAHNKRTKERIAKIADEVQAIQADKTRQRSGRHENSTLPTPERLAKGDLALAPVYNAQGFEEGRQYQSHAPIEAVKKYIEEEEFAALSRFAVNAEFARRQRRITSSYGGAPGGAFGPRDGGLPDSSRHAASVHEWMEQKLHPRYREFASLVFWAILREKEGNPLTPREIMAHFFPLMKSEARRDGGFIAMFRSFSWRIQELEQELRNALKGEVRGGEPLERVIRSEERYKARR
jgi:hypothetical protein